LPASTRIEEPTANCPGSPSLKTRSGPGWTAGLGSRTTPASAVPMATTEPQRAVRPRKSRRFEVSGISPLLAIQESLHGDGVGRAALGAKGAADAEVLVLQDGGVAGAGPVRGEQRVDLGRGLQLVERDQLEAERRADVDAAAAEDALLAVEDGVDAAVETAAGLAGGQDFRVAGLDQPLRVGEALPGGRDRDVGAAAALVAGFAAVVLDLEMKLRLVLTDLAAGEEAVNAARGLLAAGDGV